MCGVFKALTNILPFLVQALFLSYMFCYYFSIAKVTILPMPIESSSLSIVLIRYFTLFTSVQICQLLVMKPRL